MNDKPNDSVAAKVAYGIVVGLLLCGLIAAVEFALLAHFHVGY